jgi:NTP pyrophosphatase (non-canonical NTP hydrolase)
METKELQSKIIEFLNKWDKKRNSISDKQKTFNHLIEEVGELAREYVNKETGRDKYREEEVENAIGDIFIQLVKLADLYALNVEKTIVKIMEEEKEIFKE